jgi:hypothetical protein
MLYCIIRDLLGAITGKESSSNFQDVFPSSKLNIIIYYFDMILFDDKIYT